ncbi:hypothetical protein [Ancylobacter sp. SL191]|uniref:hypothetical protein n=1 Tax=Ancylobacter sp. SL191 TaxID=2995166 RepID=UPI0022707517|nr:hypothetical protein [Ancylobacter sp. SL191]WAC26264.1 hypothetical protein OU996_14750 [Ancylobacter sp. SL191]
MSNDRITLTTGHILALSWETRGYDCHGDWTARQPVFLLWRDGEVMGFASDYEAALLMAERHGRRLGCGVEDRVLETSGPATLPRLQPGPATAPRPGKPTSVAGRLRAVMLRGLRRSLER